MFINFLRYDQRHLNLEELSPFKPIELRIALKRLEEKRFFNLNLIYEPFIEGKANDLLSRRNKSPTRLTG